MRTGLVAQVAFSAWDKENPGQVKNYSKGDEVPSDDIAFWEAKYPGTLTRRLESGDVKYDQILTDEERAELGESQDPTLVLRKAQETAAQIVAEAKASALKLVDEAKADIAAAVKAASDPTGKPAEEKPAAAPAKP